MGMGMRTFVYAQLQPVKTIKQLIIDRCLYRMLILTFILMNWCF